MSFSVPQKVLDEPRALGIWEWKEGQWYSVWGQKPYCVARECQPAPKEEGLYLFGKLFDERDYEGCMPLQEFLDNGFPESFYSKFGHDYKTWFRYQADAMPDMDTCEVCGEPATISGFSVLRVGTGVELKVGPRRYACCQGHLAQITQVTEREFLSPFELTDLYREIIVSEASKNDGITKERLKEMIEATKNCLAGLEAALAFIEYKEGYANELTYYGVTAGIGRR